jgi:DNA polymerase-1
MQPDFFAPPTISPDLEDSPAVVDAAYLDEVVEAIVRHPVVAVDVETTGLDYMRDQLHGVAISAGDRDWYVTGPALPAFMPTLAEISKREYGKLWVGHNIKFDMHFLSRYGFLPSHIADTMIAQWLVDENLELGLKALAHSRLGITDLPSFNDLLKDAKKVQKKKKMADVSIFDLPLAPLATYAARDTRLTLNLWDLLQHDLDQESMNNIFWEMRCSRHVCSWSRTACTSGQCCRPAQGV